MNPIASIFAWIGRDIADVAIRLFAYYESILPGLKGISLFVSALLVAGTVYAALQSKYHHLFSDRWMDRLGTKDVLARRMRRLWNDATRGIQKRGDRAAWTDALKSADSVLQEGLKAKGYVATNAGARAETAYEAGEMETREDMRAARDAYAELKEESNPFTHEQAVAALRQYKKAIRETGVIGEKF